MRKGKGLGGMRVRLGGAMSVLSLHNNEVSNGI